MKQITTQGIVLTRTDFGEADRILTFLTPDHGKMKAIAKGVRKAKAKLAGSVELFGISDLSMIIGRGEINTLTSARLVRNYGDIVKDLNRTNIAYEFLKLLNKATADKPDEEYFILLDAALSALNDQKIDAEQTELWFKLHWLKLSGHAPNLWTNISGKKLNEERSYNFNVDKMCFHGESKGAFTSHEVKFLRLAQAAASPKVLSRVQNIDQTTIDKSLKLTIELANLSQPN
jgi:DNA repair protein RecO (recombination protein O)